MLRRLATRSSGRISAPRQAQARTAIAAAQPSRVGSEVLRSRRGRPVAAAPAASCVTNAAGSGARLLRQLVELGVDLGDLRLLLVGGDLVVVLELGALAEELELADRDELGVARILEG